MLTYVINTSENKTFDSDQLFKLVGYNKICWLNYGINELEKCAEEICEKQTVLGADDFRIAILVDFYGFDRVRSVYGSKGYSPIETGVDLSIYFPYIEAYIVDHLFSKIQRKELVVCERHVFYIQDGKHDGFNVLGNEERQLEFILEPKESSVTEVISVKVPRSELESKRKEQEEKEDIERGITEEERQSAIANYESRIKEIAGLSEEQLIARQREIDKQRQTELDNADIVESVEDVLIDVPEKRYSCFRLYCTKDLSLDFTMTDYPYTNKKGLSFHEFYLAFKQRGSQNNGIKRHHYYASFGNGIAKAAFDNLSLSLYLIKMYEREEIIKENSEFVIDSMDPEKLKSMLITSWNKICSARTIALNNGSEYYDIKSLVDIKADKVAREKSAKAFSVAESRKTAHSDAKKYSTEKIYQEICSITNESSDTFSERDKKELDKLMQNYLAKRDDTKESAAEYEFRAVRENCKTTPQCPSRNDYENVIAKKKADISELLTETISVEYINKDYTEYKEKADKAYNDYKTAKDCMGRSLVVDIGICLLSLIVMLVPFMITRVMAFGSMSVVVLTGLILTGLFILAYIIRILPLILKMKRAKRTLKTCYFDCRVKQDMAMYEYKRRYERDLIKIENLRYELRNITCLYKYNLAKNKNIEQHRQLLEIVENKLSAMLNNLGVEPVVVRYKNLEEEFDVNKSFMAKDNKIYKIFSIDAIEGLFGTKEK